MTCVFIDPKPNWETTNRVNRLEQSMSRVAKFWERWRVADVGVWRSRIRHNHDLFHGSMQAIQQREEQGNPMASAPIPETGFSSPGCYGRRLPRHCFRRAVRPRRGPTEIWSVSILETESFHKLKPAPFVRLWFLVICLSTTVICHANEASFEVVGEVQCITIEQQSTNTYFSQFQATVSANNTLIRSRLSPIPLGSDIDYYEYSCQGSNSTMVLRYPDDLTFTNFISHSGGVTKIETLNKPQRAWNQATVMVRPDPLPPYGFEFLTVVWLAFGSRCHFPETGQGLVDPVVFIESGFRESQRKAESQWIVETNPPAMLRFMAEFCDGRTFSLGEQTEPKMLPAPYNTGFTNALFRTIEWTNIMGLFLPRKFELLKFDPDFSTKSEKRLKIAYMMVGEAREYIVGKARTDLAAVIPKHSNVLDFRLPDAKSGTEYSSYQSPDGKIFGTQELIERKRDLPKHVHAQRSRFRGWILLTFFVATGTPVAILLLSRKKRTESRI